MASWTCGACDAENVPGTRFCGYCGTRRAERGLAPENVLTAALESIPEGVAASRVQSGADGDERRVVTSLFADVSGFTTLADQLDPDELHEIIAPVITELAAVAERYEGFIAKYAGDALLVFFGAPITHEDDPVRALLTATEMHAALPRLAASLPPAARGLSLHVGVNTGRVISGRYGGESRSDYSILGDAVILAQRLESVAPSGDTYVGETTYELTRDQFRFEALGELQLKGKLRPVRAWRLLGRRRSAALSGVSLDRPEVPLVGREPELAAAWSVLDRMAEGRGGVLAVAGEPGVGKSRLVRELRDQVRDAGVRWYQGRCVSYGAAVAYGPFADLLRQLGELHPDETSERVRAALARVPGVTPETLPHLGSLLGVEDETSAELTPDARRRAVHAAVVAWVTELCAQGPAVLAVEDLHWVDASSLALLGELAAIPVRHPLTLLLTTRGEGRELAASLAAGPDDVVVDVAPLGPDGMDDLLRALLEGPVPPELSSVVLERASGNPLFAEEIVRALREQGVLHHTAGRWRVQSWWSAEQVPESVERVLATRLDALPADDAATLQLAAVVGRIVPLDMLDELAATGEATAGAVDHLLEARFLDRTVFFGRPAVMFSHALVQEVAYGRTVKRRRRELHAAVAAATEKLWGDGDDVIAFLAGHYYLAGGGARAVDALVRAGRHARRLYANDETIVHLRRAVECATQAGVPSVTDLVLELAAVHELVGDFAEAHTLYEEVRAASGDVRGWRGVAGVLRKRGEYETALVRLDEAFADPRGDAQLRSALWLERSWCLGLLGRYGDAVAAAQSGLAEPCDDALRAKLLLAQGRAEANLGELARAVEHASAARDLFERLGDLGGLALALRVLGGTETDRGEPERASAILRRGLEIASRTGDAEERMACLINLGRAELACGRLDEAIRCDEQALDEADRLSAPTGRAITLVNLGEKLLARGDVTDAVARLDEGRAVAAAIGNSWVVADAQRMLAGARLRQGDRDGAALAAAEAAELFAALGNDEHARECRELADRAQAASATGAAQ